MTVAKSTDLSSAIRQAVRHRYQARHGVLPSCGQCPADVRGDLKAAALRTFLAQLGPVTEDYRELAGWLLGSRIERGDRRAGKLAWSLNFSRAELGLPEGLIPELLPWSEA